VEFKLHSFVLETQCRWLFDLVSQSQGRSVSIPNIDKSTFKAILEYIYGVKQPTLADETFAKSILCQANKFGLSNLKILAECTIAYKFLDSNNAAELLILADSHSCTLLKEEAMNLFDFQPSLIIRTNGWSNLQKSSTLLAELFEFMHCSFAQDPFESNTDLYHMSAPELLKLLDECHFELDGNRATLVERLNTKRGTG